MARIAERSLSIAPYFEVRELLRNWSNNSTVDLKLFKRFATDGFLSNKKKTQIKRDTNQLIDIYDEFIRRGTIFADQSTLI